MNLCLYVYAYICIANISIEIEVPICKFGRTISKQYYKQYQTVGIPKTTILQCVVGAPIRKSVQIMKIRSTTIAQTRAGFLYLIRNKEEKRRIRRRRRRKRRRRCRRRIRARFIVATHVFVIAARGQRANLPLGSFIFVMLTLHSYTHTTTPLRTRAGLLSHSPGPCLQDPLPHCEEDLGAPRPGVIYHRAHLSMYVNMYVVYMYIHLHMYIYIYIYTYIHIHI